jgi:hypothetical protein
MPVDFENDSTVTDAMARLEAAEASEPALPKETFEQTESGELQQSATIQGDTGGKQPDSSPTDTPATAEIKPDAAPKENETETKQPDPNAKKQSDFAKNAERLDKTWKSVNERKATLDATEAKLKAQEAALAQREQKLQLEAAKAKGKTSPEEYEQYATTKTQQAEQLALQADGLEKRAEQLEDAGKYGEAELAKKQAQDLREQASGEKYSAKKLKELADHARKNPDPTLEQHKAQLDAHKKHYLNEAAKVWPDVAKQGSAFQKDMATVLQNLAQQGIDANESPAAFYFVADYVAKAADAARVPGMEKELGALKAKVKELETLTAPGGGVGASQRVEQGNSNPTDAEEEAALRQHALSRS